MAQGNPRHEVTFQGVSITQDGKPFLTMGPLTYHDMSLRSLTTFEAALFKMFDDLNAKKSGG